MEIFIQRDGKQFGPYTAEEVRDYLSQGSLLPSDLAKQGDLETWVALHQLSLQCPAKRTLPPSSNARIKRHKSTKTLISNARELPDITHVR
jgi:hypothetical protein